MSEFRTEFRMKCRECHDYHRHVFRRVNDESDTDTGIALRAHCKGDEMSVRDNGSNYSGCGKFYTVTIPRSAYPVVKTDPLLLEDILKSHISTNSRAR